MSTIGRNDPCPCGSGKKYKKCCLNTAGLPNSAGAGRARTTAAQPLETDQDDLSRDSGAAKQPPSGSGPRPSTRAAASAGNPEVLAEVVSRVLAAGASAFELEYDGDHDLVVAFNGPVGISVATFASDSDDARELRAQLYDLSEKAEHAVHLEGLKYTLRAKMFDSFGEDAYRVTISRR